jgi:hypothetical protein
LKHLCAYAVLFLCVATTSCLFAQSISATISGIVTDPAGRAISSADVEIVDDATSIQYPTKTNEVGIYSIPVLPPGHYHMQVSKIGFKTIIKPDIVLNVQSALALNFSLPVGATSESITVEGSSSLLNTTDASVSTVIDRQFVQNIPLNGRSFQDLISMTPGVVTQSPQSQSSLGYNGDFSVNGQRTQSNYFTIDGVSANVGAGNGTGGAQPATGGTLAASTALGTTQSLLSVDALQEFRVASSTYSAEYGRSPGGQISFVTRSGTNDLHGTAFDYLRNNFFDANDWFNDHYGAPIAALRQNDFGGTLGGPVRVPELYNGKDRTFFFVSYEGLRLTQPQAASILYVPDTYLRQQAPVALQPILDAFPVQNGLDYGTSADPSLAQFIKSYSVPAQIDSTSVRIDHVISPKLAIFFRAGYTPSSDTSRTLSTVSRTIVAGQTYTLGATSQLSSRMSNEFRLGYAKTDADQTVSLDAFGGAVPIDLPTATGLSSYSPSYPYIDLYFYGIGSSTLRANSTANHAIQWNVVDTFDVSLGHHQIKAGIDYRYIVSPLIREQAALLALYYSPQSILNNSATAAVIEKERSATPIFNETAAFIQDDWRAAQNLSIAMGMRWEVDPPPHEQQGDDAYTVLGNINQLSTLALAPQGTPLWKTSWYNFAPRLGVAWTARPNPGWETIFRAGGGVFFDTDNEVASSGYSYLGFFADSVVPSAPLPLTPSQLDFTTTPTIPYATVFATPPHLQLPYTLQWNASLEQSLDRNQVLTISYVASNGRRLIQSQERVVPPTVSSDFTAILYATGGVTSNYQAMQAAFQRTVRSGLQALVSYTWAHALDYGSNASALPLTRGNSDFDVRDNLQAGMTWDLPKLRGPMLKRQVIGGWGLDVRLIARTAFPITLEGNALTDAVTGNTYYGNLDLVPNQPIYLYGNQYPGGKAVNPAAFQIPTTPDDLGNAPRNFVRGFGEAQVNLGAQRTFPIADTLRLQFRAEGFNVLNHPNFGYVDPTIGDATFGQATAMLNQSLGTVAPQYQQGGPRSMQFAIKLQF